MHFFFDTNVGQYCESQNKENRIMLHGLKFLSAKTDKERLKNQISDYDTRDNLCSTFRSHIVQCLRCSMLGPLEATR